MADKGTVVRIGGRDVTLTRPEKVLFPDDGITKADLVGYYRAIAPRMLPHLEDRPLMLERYPDGLGRMVLVQKAAAKYFPDWIPTVTVRKHGGTVRHVLCNDEATLAYLANQACITPHTWLSRADRIEMPDQLIFDLDPSGADFAEVRKTARVFQRVLEELSLPAFLKTSGSSGLHIFVPLKRDATFDQVRSMAHVIAAMVVEDDPATRTFEIMKAKRGGRIFIDINRNAWAQNVAPAFAVRPKPGAPVSVPIAWDELGRRTLRSNEWTIRTVFRHLEKTDDPWEAYWTSAVSAKKAMKNLEAHHGAR